MLALTSSHNGHREPATALDRIRQYVLRNRENIFSIDDPSLPLCTEKFDLAAGFMRRGGSQIIIPTKAEAFDWPDRDAVLRQLKTTDRLDHDPGKLSKKAPRPLTRGRRAYFIRID